MSRVNASGRRKTSVARVYLSAGNGQITVNKKDYKEYFPTLQLQQAVKAPLSTIEGDGQFDVQVNVRGGGITGQADAVKLAIAKALVESDGEHKEQLKGKGLLTRDPRMVERKKSGQKKARKKFQFVKR